MAITLNKLPAIAPGTPSYSISGNNITFSYNPAGTNYKVDYWNIKSFGYEQLEYLETDGTAYINLRDHVSSGDEYKDASLPIRRRSKSMTTDMQFSFKPGVTIPTAVRYLYGTNNNSSNKYSQTYCALNNRYLYNSMGVQSNVAEQRFPATGDGVVHKIHQLSGIYMTGRRCDVTDLDDSIKQIIPSTENNGRHTMPGICPNGSIDQNPAASGIKRWSQFFDVCIFTASKDAAGTPVANPIAGLRIHSFTTRMKPASDGNDRTFTLIPVRRGDGVLGMYDIYSGEFYTNFASSGSFIAGPSIGQYINAKIKGNNATMYYNSSKDLVVEACLYDSTVATGYTEYAPGTSAETSSLCFIKQNIQKEVQKINLQDVIMLEGTVNGGVDFRNTRGHVFYAEADGYIVGNTYWYTGAAGPTIFSVWCDDICYISTISGSGTNNNFVSDFYPFKKGDYVCYGTASNYTNGSGLALAFYV